MGATVNRQNGQNYSDNVIDDLLAFDREQTWTVSSGTGSATIDDELFYEGNSSLQIFNSAPTTDLVVTNAVQNTLIKQDGAFGLSLYLRKEQPNEFMTLEVNVFKNAVLFNTQTFVLGSETTADDIDSKWQRFDTYVDYAFSKHDVVTFTFTLKGKVGTALLNTTIWVDGLMLYYKERNNVIPPSYVPPLNIRKEYFGIYDYADATTVVTPIDLTADTWAEMTNDGAGANTNKTYALTGIADVYNVGTNRFDFSDLALGDTVSIRVDAEITTSGANQTCDVDLVLAYGEVGEYRIPFIRNEFKTAATHGMTRFNDIYIGNALTRDNPARFEIRSDGNADVVVNGWYCKVNKRLV